MSGTFPPRLQGKARECSLDTGIDGLIALNNPKFWTRRLIKQWTIKNLVDTGKETGKIRVTMNLWGCSNWSNAQLNCYFGTISRGGEMELRRDSITSSH